MNFTWGWIIGAAVLLLIIAVLGRSVQKLYQPLESKQKANWYHEEFSSEIAFPTLSLETKTPSKTSPPEIPRHYGVDRLVLMVRDPDWLFAYWEITASKEEAFNRHFGDQAWENTRPVLRVYDVTGIESFRGDNANSFIDIAIGDDMDSWHIAVGKPESSFCVDLGRLFPDGRFITLLRSNIVDTPSINISSLIDEEWMWIHGLYQTVTHLHQGSSPTRGEYNEFESGIFPLVASSPVFHTKSPFERPKQ